MLCCSAFIGRMLALLPEPAATVVAADCFLGVRRGELRGFRWEDYLGDAMRITKSVWRSHVGEPKRKSRGTVPVIPHLRRFLDRHWEACGQPDDGYIFTNALGQPMNLDALVSDVIRPALEKAGMKWHGWHAFRRGLATNMYRLGIKDKVIQQILRHANLSTTMNIYVMHVSEDAIAALDVLEKRLCATSVQPIPALVAPADNVEVNLQASLLKRIRRTGGEGGIRTLGTGVSPYNGLANRRIRPLCHLSGVRSSSLTRRARALIPLVLNQNE